MSMRGHTITDTRSLVTETCCSCGVLFALEEHYQAARRRDHAWWYCPNGHSQHYSGKTDKERAEEAERRAANAEENLRAERAAHAVTKASLTKTSKRLANGVCPCCKRSFVNLRRHMAGQHPNYGTS